LRILLLEKESAPGQHQTGRSSGVIHAGVYYEPGSLKAQFCRAGREATLAFCREHAIPYTQCGKLLVATNELELQSMAQLAERCARNSIDFETWDQRRLRAAEPAIAGLGAIHVPTTGSVSFQAVCRRMLENFTALGGSVRFNIAVTRLREQADAVVLQAGGESTGASAGLGHGLPHYSVPRRVFRAGAGETQPDPAAHLPDPGSGIAVRGHPPDAHD
jgi:L-2-hydroxyglutarate oxidase